MEILADKAWAIRVVWMRYFDVFKKSIFYYLVTTLVEPLLYLVSFGYGVGSMIGKIEVHGQSTDYMTFIISGIIGQAVLYQGFFEASYGAFIRMYYQKIFHAMAVTPITLSEVLWAELIWDSTKGTFAAETVALIGVILGIFPAKSLLLLLPLCFLGSLLFSAMGLAVAAFSETIEQISWPQYLLVYPMFLFCGVFYPIENLPAPIQAVAWCLPLTAFNSISRTLVMGFPFQPQAIPLLLVWLVFLVFLSLSAMTRRLVK